MHLVCHISPTGTESFIAFGTEKEVIIFCTPIIEGGRERGGGEEEDGREGEENWVGSGECPIDDVGDGGGACCLSEMVVAVGEDGAREIRKVPK